MRGRGFRSWDRALLGNRTSRGFVGTGVGRTFRLLLGPGWGRDDLWASKDQQETG